MDQLWANRAASAEAAIAKRHLQKLWAAAGNTARRRRLAGGAQVPDVRHLALLVAGPPAGLPGRRRSCAIRSPTGGRRSPGRSAATGCATTCGGPTTTTTTWRGWRSPSSAPGGWRASSGPRHWTSCPNSSSTHGCPRTAAESRGASRTSSSTPRPTARRRSSWPATTGCAGPSRWRTGSTKR